MEDQIFKNDASNGLSYTQMKHEVDKRHPRIVKNGVRVKLPIFGTNTGTTNICSKTNFSDLRQFGPVLTLYFTLLKFLTILFGCLSIISVLLYYYCGYGGKSFDTSLSVKEVLTF